MFKILKFLLPVLIPSWRFFDVIAPSPRIEYTWLVNGQEMSDNWQEFRPRPLQISAREFVKRMFYNARWNESLFLMSCAERLMQNPTEHIEQEIINRIKIALKQDSVDCITTLYLQFRLVFFSRCGDEIQKHVTYTSPIFESV